MERLDQGHLHLLLEDPRQTCPVIGLNPWPTARQASTLAKSYCNSLCYCYLEPLQYLNIWDYLPVWKCLLNVKYTKTYFHRFYLVDNKLFLTLRNFSGFFHICNFFASQIRIFRCFILIQISFESVLNILKLNYRSANRKIFPQNKRMSDLKSTKLKFNVPI